MRQVQEDTQTQVLYVLNNSLQSSSEEFPFKNLSMYHLLKQVSYSCLNLVHSGEIDAIFLGQFFFKLHEWKNDRYKTHQNPC